MPKHAAERRLLRVAEECLQRPGCVDQIRLSNTWASSHSTILSNSVTIRLLSHTIVTILEYI